jgi:dihydrofolate reductase
MAKVVATISMSLDGYIAGPHPTLEEPLGKGGEALHEWVVKLASWRQAHGMEGGDTGSNNDVVEKLQQNIGAVIMGRRMFSGGQGPWEKDPNPDGWWGDTPPFHAPVFILTSHQRASVTKEGGTTFTFVTDGIESAYSQAKQAAGDKDISIAGGANTIQQAMTAGLIDEPEIHLVPLLLGGGTRLLENLEGVRLEKIRVLDSPEVTHLTFRVIV